MAKWTLTKVKSSYIGMTNSYSISQRVWIRFEPNSMKGLVEVAGEICDMHTDTGP